MLILAGVSLNAIVGDNGILKNAQDATIAQSEADLTEFLQEKYLEEEIDQITSSDNINETPLAKMKTVYASYFYDPRNDSTVSTGYDYIYYYDTSTNSYYSLYFIKKSGLPDEIKKQLKGGDALDESGAPETYSAYSSLTDCYLVSSDLQVHYLNGKLNGVKGLTEDTEGGLKVAYQENDPWAKLLTGDSSTAVTMQDTLSKTEIEINGTDGIKDLLKINNLTNLTKLTLTNYTGSLQGLGNLKKLTYLYIRNSDGTTNITYSGMDGATALTQLYFYNPTDVEVEKLCNAMSGIDYTSLATIAFYGGNDGTIYREITDLYYSNRIYSNRSSLTTVSYLDKLSTETKKSVKVAYLHNNVLTSLVGLNDFTEIYSLYANYNNINSDLSELQNLSNVSNCFLGYNKLTNESYANLVNLSNIRILSTPGNNSVTNIDVIQSLNNLNGMRFTSNTNLVLSNNATVLKISGLSQYYFDSKYANDISLANIKSEIYLNTDADDSHLEKLKGKTQIQYLEIPNNKKITNDKLMEILPTLTNLFFLVADGSNLTSLNWITANNSNLQYISINGCAITDLTGIERCKNLCGLRVNTNGLNLYPYSSIISNMCSRGAKREGHLKCGTVSIGGLNAPPALLNTLNGTSSSINNDLKYFSNYCGDNYNYALVDFTYTGLQQLRTLYAFITIRVPSCYKSFNGSECAAAIIDYTNVSSCDRYYACQVISSNYSEFNGYSYVSSETDPSSIVGINTTELHLGEQNRVSQISVDWDLICDKANNLEKLVVTKDIKLFKLSTIQSLSCNTMSFSNCVIKEIGLTKGSNLANNLQSLTLNNNKLTSLSGLKYAKNITTLNLSNNLLQNTFTYVDDDEESETYGKNVTVKTCDYIASLPNLKAVYLGGNSDLTDYSGLINAGFSQNGTTFTK